MEKGHVRPGTVIAGKYRIDRVMGRGGMGVVLAATDTKLRRAVAVKVLLPMVAADPTAVERFLREARAAVQLTSEHTVRVFDVGELEDGVPFMVMELLVGSDLQTLISERGRLSASEAVGYILQAIEGIGEAHSRGIIHRDVKPANLFVTRRGDGSALVKVLDFGLAKTMPEPGEKGLTKTAAVMGSPQYMSPEQMRGLREVDARADVWALGASLYELVVGRCPFDAPSVIELALKIITTEPQPPHEVFADIPSELSHVIIRCLQKGVEARFENVAQLAAALEPWAPAQEVGGTAGRVERVLSRPEAGGAARVAASLDDSGRLPEPERTSTGKSSALAETVTAGTLDPIAPRPGRPRWVIAAIFAAGVGAALAGQSLFRPHETPTTRGTATASSPPVAAAQPELSEPAPPVGATPDAALRAVLPAVAPPPAESMSAAAVAPPTAPSTRRQRGPRPKTPSAPTAPQGSPEDHL